VLLDIPVLRVFDDKPAAAKAKLALLYVLLIAANGFAWLWAFAQFSNQPILLGTASLAYTLGLRHAVDPDHIAAIDNVTRKLMQEGKRPISAGLFFALGHLSVVIIASLLVALSIGALKAKFDWFKEGWRHCWHKRFGDVPPRHRGYKHDDLDLGLSRFRCRQARRKRNR